MNDNETVERYTILSSQNDSWNCFWGEHAFRVFDGPRAVSVGFATYAQAERCRAVLIADDYRLGVRRPPATASC